MIQPVRSAAFAASLLVFAATTSLAQRGSRGTIGVPRVVTTPLPTTSSTPPRSSGRATGSGPHYPTAGVRRAGDLPRIVSEPPRRRDSSYGNGYGNGVGGGGVRYNDGRAVNRGTRIWRQRPYTRWGVGAGCGFGCGGVSVGLRSRGFFGSFMIGYPFAVPVMVPYYGYGAVIYDRYVETSVEPYEPEPEPSRSASKLIVIGGGTGGGGDALTIETIADSVRLSWLGAARPAREVILFVADSAQRRLATRSASPSAPTATFEVATLSAPVAFAGVSVTFVDGVTSTTLVPYRGGATGGQRR